MALTRKTVVDQIEITRNGGVQLRLAIIIEDGGEEISTKYHRTAFRTSADVAPTMALVNDHLGRMRVPTVPPAAINRIEAIVKAVEPYVAIGSPT